MLALMAGRNGAETLAVVRNGEVYTANYIIHLDSCPFSGQIAPGHRLAFAGHS